MDHLSCLVALREQLRAEGLEAELDAGRVPEQQRYYLGRMDAFALAVAWVDDVIDKASGEGVQIEREVM